MADQAALAVQELRGTLGIDIQQLNLAVTALPDSPVTYRVVCTVLSTGTTEPVEMLLMSRVMVDVLTKTIAAHLTLATTAAEYGAHH